MKNFIYTSSQEELIEALNTTDASQYIYVDYYIVQNLGLLLLKNTIQVRKSYEKIIINTSTSLSYLITAIEHQFPFIITSIDSSIFEKYELLAKKYNCLIFCSEKNLIEYLENNN
jgi:hypothetical protein